MKRLHSILVVRDKQANTCVIVVCETEQDEKDVRRHAYNAIGFEVEPIKELTMGCRPIFLNDFEL